MMTQEDFVALLKPLQDRLFRTACRMLLSEEDAKDALQDALVKIWNKREQLEKCESVEAWCLTVMKNTARDKLKYESYRVTDELTTGAASVSNISLDSKDLVQITSRLINQLPEKQRMLIHFRDMEGMDYKMIAEIMSMTIGEVKIGLFRARKQIREQIAKIISYGTK